METDKKPNEYAQQMKEWKRRRARIKKAHASGKSISEIAREEGVSRQRVSDLLKAMA